MTSYGERLNFSPRNTPLSNRRLFLRRWRQQAIEAEVHGGGTVMVGPVVSEGDQREGARAFAPSKYLNFISQLGIINFAESGGAKIKARLQCRDQLVFTVGFLQRYRHIDLGNVANCRAQVVVRTNDVQDELAERQLLFRGPVAKLIGGHLFDRRYQVFFLARQNLFRHRRDWIFVLCKNCCC